MPKIKYPSSFLKARRESLGLTQQTIANVVGITRDAMMKLEQRGEIPETHIKKLAEALAIEELDLLIEKYAPVIRANFHIPTEVFRNFVRRNVGTDRAFGKKVSIIGKPRLDENDPEFKRLPDTHKAVLRKVSKMTARQGFKSLIESGIYTPEGNLAPEYGGPKRKK